MSFDAVLTELRARLKTIDSHLAELAEGETNLQAGLDKNSARQQELRALRSEVEALISLAETSTARPNVTMSWQRLVG